MALYLLVQQQEEGIHKMHDIIFCRHNATLKTYLKITSLYVLRFIRMYSNMSSAASDQQRKQSTEKTTPQKSLPILDKPNLRIHVDLYGSMIAAKSNKKYVVYIPHAFTKHAVVTAITNKAAERVTGALFKAWFCKFGIPAQIC